MNSFFKEEMVILQVGFSVSILNDIIWKSFHEYFTIFEVTITVIWERTGKECCFDLFDQIFKSVLWNMAWIKGNLVKKCGHQKFNRLKRRSGAKREEWIVKQWWRVRWDYVIVYIIEDTPSSESSTKLIFFQLIWFENDDLVSIDIYNHYAEFGALIWLLKLTKICILLLLCVEVNKPSPILQNTSCVWSVGFLRNISDLAVDEESINSTMVSGQSQ